MEKKSHVTVIMNSGLLRIVVIGPESTGKSTLCRQLAEHYGSTWCPEFAREYLLRNGSHYRYEDLLEIARGQLVMEDAYAEKEIGRYDSDIRSVHGRPILFIDTDMYVMKVWSEFVFGKCDQWVIDRIVERKYDLYLLCHTDIPWEKDELREYPDLETRNRLFHMYRDILVNQSVPWVDIFGNQEERLDGAIRAIDGLLNNMRGK
jgi:NadR type nicotinamide-nucleotide adenylyltransferase